MNKACSSLRSRAQCEVRSAKCAYPGDPRAFPVSLFEEAWMRLSERLRHGTSHLAPRTAHVSEANTDVHHA